MEDVISATSTTSARARNGWPSAVAARASTTRRSSGLRRRIRSRSSPSRRRRPPTSPTGPLAARGRRAPAGDGLAGALALPPRRRSRRCRLLAEAGALDRHRRRSAARARARLRDRAVRGPALRRCPARSRRTLARRRRCDPGAVRRARRGALRQAEGAAFAAPSCSGRSERPVGRPLQPASRVRLEGRPRTRRTEARRPLPRRLSLRPARRA